MGQKVKLGRSLFTIGFLAAFLGGVFLADQIVLGFSWSVALLGMAAIAIYLFRKEPPRLLIATVAGGFIIGLTYYHFWDFRENQKILPYGQISIIAPMVQKPVISGAKAQLILGYQKTNILVQTPRFPQFSYGDILKVTGTLENPAGIKPFNGFDYGDYLLKKDIRGLLRNPDKIEKVGSDGNPITKKIYALGDKFNNSINQVLAEPYAALQIGLLFGNKTDIPDSLMSAFSRTGTTHIVAVSGYNVTIIITAISLILARFSRRLAFFGTIFSIIFFVILTGAGASVLRAGLLAGLAAWAKISGRRPYYPLLILLVAFILTLFNPYILKNDISFQLSFLAFIGLMMIAPIFEQARLLATWPATIRIAFAQTIGAQILVLPILFYNFGILSLVAPLANILILPLVPAAMFLGIIAGSAGLIWDRLGYLAGLIAWLPLKYIIIVEQFLSGLPWAAVSVKVTSWWWIPLYYLLVILCLRSYYKNKEIDDR